MSIPDWGYGIFAWVMGPILLLSLFLIIRDAYIKPDMSRTDRLIRIIGGGLWATLIIAALLARLTGHLR
jgi:hypothetical protein